MTTITKMSCSDCGKDLDPNHNKFDYMVALKFLDLDGVGKLLIVDLCSNCKDILVAKFVSMIPTIQKENL